LRLKGAVPAWSHNENMGLWGNLASLSGLGPDDPGSNSLSLLIIIKRAAKVRAAPFNKLNLENGKN